MGHALIVKTRQAWLDQAGMGVAVADKYPAMNLRDLFNHTAKVNPDDNRLLCLMVEALIALGQNVSQEMKDLAHIVPVDQELGFFGEDD